MRCVMRRLALLAAAATVAVLLTSAGPAFAAADDDIPGVSLAIGTTVSGALGPGDPADVYAVDLIEGQEVHFRCDPGMTNGPTGSFHLLVPGASSLGAPDRYDEITYNLSGGNPTRYWADFDYIPAKSGTFYLWIEWEGGTLGYTLSVTRTSRAALTLAPDTDDIPGLSVGSGSLTGVVSTLADPDDVYAVALTAGKPVTIRLAPLTPYHNSSSAQASLHLLGPGTPSLADRYGHVLEGLVPAKNSNDAASRQTAEIRYTPTESGVHYIWVEAGNILLGYSFGNFAYQLSISGNGDPSGPPVFSDVEGSAYATAIHELAERAIIKGFADHTFRPDEPVSRQQFAKMIVKTLGLAVTGTEYCPFTDVVGGQDDDPFYPDKYVAVCAAHGITRGKTPTAFGPYESITHQQLITMVARAAGLLDPPAGYAPAFVEGQFFPDEHFLNARKAAYAGLLEGLQAVGPSYDFFAPSTRGECAQLLYNLLGRQ
ncbi:MAG: S-layer homology domain-containing protein [bacterium]